MLRTRWTTSCRVVKALPIHAPLHKTLKIGTPRQFAHDPIDIGIPLAILYRVEPATIHSFKRARIDALVGVRSVSTISKALNQSLTMPSAPRDVASRLVR